MPFGGRNILAIVRAANKGNLEEVCSILKQHADTDGSLKGNSPLFIACAAGLLTIVQFLIEKANMNMHEINKNGITPFMVAVEKNNKEIVEFLQKIEKQKELHKQQESLLTTMNKTMREINSIKNSISERNQEVKNLEREREEQTLLLREELTQEKFRNIQISI